MNNLRRTILTWLWAGLGIGVLAQLGAGILALIKPGNRNGQGKAREQLVVAGGVDDFKPGTVTAFAMGHFYLARLGDGGFLALSRQCTHLGCSLPWDDKEEAFICPCHSSRFDIAGRVLKTPATRPLDIYALSIENNTVRVNTARRMRRSSFDSSQVVYADLS